MTRLFRSRTDRKITGLCGGLAETLNIDSNLLRLLLVITAFFSGGVVIPLYFLAVIVIPNEPYTGKTVPSRARTGLRRLRRLERSGGILGPGLGT
ncbi:PspC domain-containing protein [Paenibacillus sp. TAB 01]|uniref:PspC domain-containing protein n=1 Tax=Paenibacillus sp. TAB 01 TaxID=3368988 RepID=UPI0037515237